MTTTTETTEQKTKKVPDFYIFAPGADGKNQRVGAAFRHGKGNGFNFIVAGKRYSAFPPKAKTAAQPELPDTTEQSATEGKGA